MNIKIFGWENEQLSQIKRIREGFINLGHFIVNENPDIIYCNNDFYDEPIKYSKQYRNAIKIFNVLDLQLDNPNYSLSKLREQLLRANYITCISKTVQKQIKDNLDLYAHVILNPVKDVYPLPIGKEFPFLYVGRANCPNKRYNLITETFQKANWDASLIRVIGSEMPYFGMYGGIVSDYDLNKLYNQAGITLLPSKFEGLGLTGIESLICGTPVIECSDNPTAKEFIPECMICDPNPHSILIKIKEINDKYEEFSHIALEYGNIYNSAFNKNQIAKNIIELI